MMHVYQFKITLADVLPPIWRRIQIPAACTFWDLHVALQDAMGWQDCHLHAFTATDPATSESVAIGIPDDFGADFEASWERSVAKFIVRPSDAVEYEYDFGDGWRHSIVLEEIVPAKPQVRYPVCIDGAQDAARRKIAAGR